MTAIRGKAEPHLRAAVSESRGPGTTPAASLPSSRNRDTAVALLYLVAAIIYYEALIFAVRGGLFPPVARGLTFNSMLMHLLRGRFDVDPSAIGFEGFLRNGKTYAYFGILPALLRLVFLPLPHFATTDFTALSCLAAAALMALFKLLSLLTVWHRFGDRRDTALVVLFGSAILLSGAQIEFLVPSIYQEVCLWADVFAAAFVYLVLRGYCSEEGFTGGLLALMALAAGLCLLTRVSTALGLYIAFGLLWIHLACRRLRATPTPMSSLRGLVPLLAAGLLLAGFVVVTGFINYERWGNPLTFADFHRALSETQLHPDRLVRLETYGEFNPIRVGYGLVYYFFPVWVLRGADGHLLWAAFQHRVIDGAELPPSSFFLSDPLLIGLTGYTLFYLMLKKDIRQPGVVGAVMSGLLVPGVLMLCAIYMAFRYRIEFYPFFEFCAFIGFAHLLSRPGRTGKTLFAAGAVIGIAAAQILYILYTVSPLGPATRWYLSHIDLLSFYRMMLYRWMIHP